MNSADHIHSKGLKATPVRMKVLDELSKTHLALSQSELESTFRKVDRITLYRALRDFEEAGIVHKIVDMNGTTRFAICSDDCPDATHNEEHVHFNCQRCHKMFCLQHTHIPDIQLPPGFTHSGINVLVQGICNKCS